MVPKLYNRHSSDFPMMNYKDYKDYEESDGFQYFTSSECKERKSEDDDLMPRNAFDPHEIKEDVESCSARQDLGAQLILMKAHSLYNNTTIISALLKKAEDNNYEIPMEVQQQIAVLGKNDRLEITKFMGIIDLSNISKLSVENLSLLKSLKKKVEFSNIIKNINSIKDIELYKKEVFKFIAEYTYSNKDDGFALVDLSNLITSRFFVELPEECRNDIYSLHIHFMHEKINNDILLNRDGMITSSIK